MMNPDFAAARLFVSDALASGAIEVDAKAANYLVNVLRLRAGDTILLFNGRDGEWRARLAAPKKRGVSLLVEVQTRPQTPVLPHWLLFAPLKHARLDYMVQKAVEMGAGMLQPVLTRRTQVTRVNLERMRANAIEAAEQCGILTLPEVRPEATLDAVLDRWPAERPLVFCDEEVAGAPVLSACERLPNVPLAVLIGPEGGFESAERARLMSLPQVVRLPLGPRVLRADTAAVAAMTLVQTMAGDWR